MMYNAPSKDQSEEPWHLDSHLSGCPGLPDSFSSHYALQFSPPYKATHFQSSRCDRDALIAQVPYCMVIEGKSNKTQGLVLLLKQRDVQVPKVSLKW